MHTTCLQLPWCDENAKVNSTLLPNLNSTHIINYRIIFNFDIRHTSPQKINSSSFTSWNEYKSFQIEQETKNMIAILFKPLSFEDHIYNYAIWCQGPTYCKVVGFGYTLFSLLQTSLSKCSSCNENSISHIQMNSKWSFFIWSFFNPKAKVCWPLPWP
jgi:hypothetical protein